MLLMDASRSRSNVEDAVLFQEKADVGMRTEDELESRGLSSHYVSFWLM